MKTINETHDQLEQNFNEAQYVFVQEGLLDRALEGCVTVQKTHLHRAEVPAVPLASVNSGPLNCGHAPRPRPPKGRSRTRPGQGQGPEPSGTPQLSRGW